MGISLGMVGIGMFGRGFVKLFRDHPLVERIALCDIQADRLKKACEDFEITEAYDSLDAICQTDLDALVIITQPWLHAPQAIQAMEAGKSVYSAVPIITLSDGDQMLDWCDKIVDTSRRTGKHYMMGETSYYRPEAMYCRRRAADFGRFVLAEGEYFHDIDLPSCSLREVAKNRHGKNWDPETMGGGVPMHYPTHSIGGLLSVMQTHMTRVAAVGYQHPNDDWFRSNTKSGNLLSNETALFQLANGSAARICEYRRIGHVGRESFQIFGTDASFRSDGEENGSWVDKEHVTPLSIEVMRDPMPEDVLTSMRKGFKSDDETFGGHGGSHAYLVHEFVSAVAEDRHPAVNAWIAARFYAPGVMAHKSALKDGEWLDVPDWGDPPA